MNHTPTPWHYQEKADVYTHIIRGQSGNYIVGLSQDSSGKARATAKFIVKACNNHETLIKTIKAFLDSEVTIEEKIILAKQAIQSAESEE